MDSSAQNQTGEDKRHVSEIWRLALDAAHLGWWSYDPVTKTAFNDERCLEMFGVANSARTLEDVLVHVHPDDRQRVWAKVEEALNPSGSGKFIDEFRVLQPDESMRWLEVYGTAIFKGEGEAKYATQLIGTVADITTRKAAEERERRLRSVYRALSATNEAIVRESEESALFERVCEIAVDYGEMILAWVVIPDEKSHRFNILAKYGKASAFVEGIEVSASPNTPTGRGTMGTAYRENHRVIIDDFCSYENLAPWHDRARAYGVNSVATYPIRRDGKPYAVFSIYSDQVGAFDAEIVSLLDRMTENISYALDNIQREAQRRQYQAELAEKEELLTLFVKNSPAKIAMFDRNMRFIAVSKRFAEELNLDENNIVGRYHDEVFPRYPDRWREAHQRGLAGEPVRQDEDMFMRSDGTKEWRRWEIMPWYRGDEVGGIVLFTESITNLKQAQERERRIRKMYQALSATGEAIIHAESSEELLPKVCRIAVDYGEMALAWMGIIDKPGIEIVSAASHGNASGFVDEINPYVSPDRPEGRGPVGIAFREERSIIVNDVESDDIFYPWKDKARAYGIKSLAAFPVPFWKKPYAIFAVYSAQSGAFDTEIVSLLTEMAANVSFALDNFEKERLRREAESALKGSEARLKQFYDAGLIGVIYWNVDGRIADANGKFLEMVGYSRADLEAGRLRWMDMLSPESREVSERAIAELKENTINKRPYEKTYIRKNGTLLSVEIASAMLNAESGVAFVLDITERKKAEEQMRLTELVFNDTSEAMMVTDASNNIISVNPAFEKVTGYGKDEVIGKNPRILKSGEHGPDFYQGLWKSINESGRWEGEIWNKAKDGTKFAVLAKISTSYTPDGQVYRRVSLFSDITKKKASDELIWQQANFDTLTGLPNRRLFRDRLSHEIRNSRRSAMPMSLMLLDMDGFKDVNDTLGHDMGDLLLKEAAARLKSCVRENDTVARLGGDEFTVIMAELNDVSRVDRIARHILARLSEPFILGGELAHVSASIGITLYPQDAEGGEELVRNADQAMYSAKQEGKNRYHFYTQDMQQAAMYRMRLINDLRDALDKGQIEIVYQPIAELETGCISKAEALIRWQHPVRGQINPEDFISAAEETGLITSLGNWMVQEAIHQVAKWRQQHHPQFQVSVNVSPVQFRNGNINFIQWSEYLKQAGLDGNALVIEITEGLLLEANEKVKNLLLFFRDNGIEVSLDDFGTGYSALSYLQKFDIDYLKIDQAFVRNIASGSTDLALCEAIIEMAHKLKMQVIAEGVEKGEQKDLLTKAGCDFFQGYLLSKPLSAAKIDELLRTGSYYCPDDESK